MIPKVEDPITRTTKLNIAVVAHASPDFSVYINPSVIPPVKIKANTKEPVSTGIPTQLLKNIKNHAEVC